MSTENLRRSFAKTMTWRTLAFLDTLTLALIFTGKATHAFAIGGIEILTKSVLYFFHERIWLFISAWHDRTRRNPVGTFSHTRMYCGLKTVSWRVVGSVDTFFIALVITGDLAISMSIGGLELVTKMVLYYLHERAWVRVRWGKGVRDGERVPENSLVAQLRRVM